MKYFEDNLIAFFQKGEKIKKTTKKEDKKEEPTIYSKLIMYPGFISMGDMGNYPGVRAMEMKQQNTPQSDNTPKVTKYFLEKYASKPQAELKADNRSEAERQLALKVAKTMTPGTYEYNVTTNPTRLWYSDPNGTGAMLTATGYTIPAAKQAAIDYFRRPVGEILKSEGTALNHTLNPLMVTDDVFQGAKQQMREGNPLGAMALGAVGFGMGAASSLPLKPVAGAVSQGVKTGAKAAVNTHYRLANAIDNAVEGAMNGAATAPQRVPATSIVNNGNGTLGLLSGGLGDYFMTMAENSGNRFWGGVKGGWKGFKEGFKKKAASAEEASETTLNPSTPTPENETLADIRYKGNRNKKVKVYGPDQKTRINLGEEVPDGSVYNNPKSGKLENLVGAKFRTESGWGPNSWIYYDGSKVKGFKNPFWRRVIIGTTLVGTAGLGYNNVGEFIKNRASEIASGKPLFSTTNNSDLTQQQSDSVAVVNKGIEDANKLALLDAQDMNKKLQQADSSLKAFQQSIQ